MSDAPKVPLPSRRKFLVVIDQTPECKVALRFAARRAQHTGGIVSLLCIVSPASFQQWAGVERLMQDEAQEEAERLLHDAAKTVNEITGTMPELVIREGAIAAEVLGLIKEDKDISILVLASSSGTESPGPLVSMIAGPVSKSYPLPVTVVPGSLSDEAIDALA
jgi:nucleotide-binding universal stress UspA family protein